MKMLARADGIIATCCKLMSLQPDLHIDVTANNWKYMRAHSLAYAALSLIVHALYIALKMLARARGI